MLFEFGETNTIIINDVYIYILIQGHSLKKTITQLTTMLKNRTHKRARYFPTSTWPGTHTIIINNCYALYFEVFLSRTQCEEKHQLITYKKKIVKKIEFIVLFSEFGVTWNPHYYHWRLLLVYSTYFLIHWHNLEKTIN